MRYKPATFVTVPSKYRLMEVDAIAQGVFLWLCDHMNRDTGLCFPSINKLAGLCQVSRNTVKDRIKKLEQAGLIKKTVRKTRDGKNSSNLYQILIDDRVPPRRGRSNAAPYRSTDDQGVDDRMATNQNHTEPKLKNQRESALHALSPKEFTREFFAEDSPLPGRMIDAICREAHVPRDVAEVEMRKFLSYWTEPNPDGTQLRWQLHRSFGVKKRFVGWLGKMEIT